MDCIGQGARQAGLVARQDGGDLGALNDRSGNRFEVPRTAALQPDPRPCPLQVRNRLQARTNILGQRGLLQEEGDSIVARGNFPGIAFRLGETSSQQPGAKQPAVSCPAVTRVEFRVPLALNPKRQ